MSTFSPQVVVTLLASVATQVAGALLIPSTKGLTALWPTVAACAMVLVASYLR